MVNGPTLPKNIVTVMTNRPAVDSPCVIPVDKPTVPNADTISNIILIKSKFSVNVINRTTIAINPSYKITSVSA